MREVNWLDKVDVLAIHAGILRQTDEPPELLSDHLLESALARPLNLAAYGKSSPPGQEDVVKGYEYAEGKYVTFKPDLFDLAASFAEAIARNHCFANGNKRTAFIAADPFLKADGIELPAERGDEHTKTIVALSQGLMSRDEFAAYLKTCALDQP